MSLFEIAIRRPIFISMTLLVFVVFGVVAFPRVGIDFFPKVEPPVATVLTVYPGADSETVEREITEKIEDALGQLSGIDTLKSVSVDNVSQVVVVFDMDMEAASAIQDVRDKISRVIDQLPPDAKTPTVEKLDLGAMPILTLATQGPGRVDGITEMVRNRIVEPLQGIPGVGAIDIVGGIDREIKVWVDPLKLEAAGLAVTDVIGALQANNLEYPGGHFKSGQQELIVRVDGELKDSARIGRLPILDVGGRVVRIEDVARIEDGLQEARSLSSTNGERTVTMLVRKQSGSNSLAVAKAVREELTRLDSGLPEGYRTSVISDSTLFTEASFNAVWFDLAFGGVLAVIIVFFFLRNFRSTFIAALAIPTSVVATFAFIWFMGFSFNTLTLLALTLSIGLLIDDAIVVIENIYRHMELGKPARQAALEGSKEIALAVLATTLSVAAVFLPAALAGGMLGIMMYEFGMTVVFAVLFSLFVSFTLTPMLSSRILGEPKSTRFTRAIEWVLSGIDGAYRWLLRSSLRHPIVVIVLTLGVFAATVYAAGFLKMEFIPHSDQGSFTVSVELPPGTAIDKTEQVADDVATHIRETTPEVLRTIVKVGADVQQSQNKAEIFVGLTDKKDRGKSANELIEEVRVGVSGRDDANVTVNPPSIAGDSAMMAGAAVQFNLRAGDLSELKELADAMIAELSKVEGFVDLSTSLKDEKPEIAVEIDHERASSLGVPTVLVGQSVRALVGGVDASVLRDRGEEYDIRVRLEENFRERFDQFGGLKVRSATTGQLIDLSNVATLERSVGRTQIDRQSRQRQVTVNANLTGSLALGEAQKIVEQTAARIVPSSITTDWGGQVRSMGQSATEFAVALVLAVILIYMVLAAQFESLVHPLVIMLAMPLSVIGAFAALIITGQNLSIVTFIGFLMLFGLVLKNGILLVDYTNTLRRRDGFSVKEALLEAGPTRLRPILMTTLAMVFGMLPVALSTGWGAEIRVSMAWAVIGGLIASTLLTLVVVPSVYSLVEALGAFIKALFGKKEPAEPGSVAKEVTA